MKKPAEGRGSSFWTTLPGLITAIASLIGALGAIGLIHAAVTSPGTSSSIAPVQGAKGGDQTGTEVSPPQMPVNFHVDNGPAGVVLSWSPPASDANVVAYDVYRDDNPDPVRIETLQVSDLTLITGVYQWTDTGVQAGEAHTYRMASVDDKDRRSPLTAAATITFSAPSGPGQ